MDDSFLYYLVSDFRENIEVELRSNCSSCIDHPSKANIEHILNEIQGGGRQCILFGGVKRLAGIINEQYELPENVIFLNFSDGLKQSYSRVQVPLLCEIIEAPYSGTGVFESALINNKYCTNLTLGARGIKVPRSIRVTKNYMPSPDDIECMLPVFIKPNTEGSSIGITQDSLQKNVIGAIAYIKRMLTIFDDILIEEYVAGYDMTVFLIGNHGVFSCNEALYLTSNDSEFLTDVSKAHGKVARMSASEVIGKDLSKALCLQAAKTFSLLGCRDYARLDYRISEDHNIFFIEANTCPRVSESSEIGHIAYMKNSSFGDYVNLLVTTVEDRVSSCLSGQS